MVGPVSVEFRRNKETKTEFNIEPTRCHLTLTSTSFSNEHLLLHCLDGGFSHGTVKSNITFG